jgi:hypothetical protein
MMDDRFHREFCVKTQSRKVAKGTNGVRGKRFFGESTPCVGVEPSSSWRLCGFASWREIHLPATSTTEFVALFMYGRNH